MSKYNQGFRDDDGVWHKRPSASVKRAFQIGPNGDEALAVFSRGKRCGYIACDLRVLGELIEFLKSKQLYSRKKSNGQ